MPLVVTVAILAVSAGLVVFYAPGFEWEAPQQLASETKTPNSEMNNKQADDYFIISGVDDDDTHGDTRMLAKLYKPPTTGSSLESSPPPPVVVMAHGMGLIQDFGLLPFIEGFNNIGLAVVTFDYPNFGASDTAPGRTRHVMIPWNNWKHIHRVVQFLQDHKREEVDASRIALWGTSLAGGHVLEAAAAAPAHWQGNSPIKAVISNVPHTQSGLETILAMLIHDPLRHASGLIRVLGAVFKQVLTPTRAWYIPLHGPPGSAAIMQNEGDDEGYGAIYKDSSVRHDWRNGATVFSALRVLMYRPMNLISNPSSRIQVPTLLVAAEKDTLCPLHAIERAATFIPKSDVMTLPNASHFDVYHDDLLFNNVRDTMTSFLGTHLMTENP